MIVHSESTDTTDVPVLIVHGGAGPRRAGDERDEAQLARELKAAVEAGFAALRTHDAVAACVAAVACLEACPLFNAGTGSALADDECAWCDATVMGGDGRAGAVAAVRGIVHPVRAALSLRDADGPVVWAGRSEELAARFGLERCAPEAMVVERQRRRLAEIRGGRPPEATGTVGAVALDFRGRLAAATSTGGYAGKPPARVGDSALPGAGTWAADGGCAVSATGDGEAFVRTCFAHEVHARMRWGGEELPRAASAALEGVRRAGGRGAAICVDAAGRIAMPSTAEVFLRAWRRGNEPVITALEA